MAWKIKLLDDAEKSLDKLDKPVAKRILEFLYQRVAHLDDPRNIGEPLQGPRYGNYWKYRVGDYRIISSIQDQELRILVVKIGNRREVYRKK